MKTFLKYLAIVIVVIIVILIIAPFLFKKQIVDRIKQEANEQLNATVNFDNDISLSFFRNFPNASLGVNDLSVVGKGEYKGDTLAYIDELHIVIDLTSLFGGKTYQIRNVTLDKPYIQLLVDSLGKANWNITKGDSTTAHAGTSSSFKAALQKYSIEDGRLIYADSSIGFILKAEGLDHTGRGDFTQDIFDLTTHSHVNALTIIYAGIPYLNRVKTDMDADINIDIPKSKYTFTKNTIKLNGLTLGVNGYVALPDSNDVDINLSFKATKADFKNFLSLIPAVYQKDFDDLKASGKLSFNGFVKGIYNDNRIPAFNLELTINKGMFQYPSVPEPLSNVNLDLVVNNTDGNLDHTLINIKQLHFRMGQNPFDAHLTIQNPKSDPLIDGAVKGKLNLSEISKIYPLEKGTKLSGLLNLNVQAKGRLSAAENKKYDQFQASGQAVARDLVYQSSTLKRDIYIPGGSLIFSPQQVKVSNLSARIGKSDIQADGGMDNLFGYLFGKDKLKGHLDVRSKLLNLNEIMGADATTSDTTSHVKAVIIPGNIDFSLKTNIQRFVYDNYDLRNVVGNIEVNDGILTIKNISTNMLDGSAQLSGTYNTQNPKIPKTNLSFKANNINIQKAFKTFNTVQALAPIAAFVQGNFSGDISLSTLLNDNLYPKLTSVNSIGKLSIPNLNIKGFAPLQMLASSLNMQQLKNIDLHKLLLYFEIDSGFLKVRPFSFMVDSIKMNVSGKNGLNKAIDYTINMNIPREKLGDADNALTNLITQANKATGGNLDLGDHVIVGISLGGTITKPTVKLDLSEEKSRVETALKKQAKRQLSKNADKLLNQLFKKDSVQSVDTTHAQNPAKTIKNALQKGLQGLLNKKKDTGRK